MVEQNRQKLARLSDAELVEQMHQWAPHSEKHIAAKLLLFERNAKRERYRFHMVFWPAFVAAIASALALLLDR